MKQRLYLDVNSGVGRQTARNERIPYTIESLLDEMKYYRIHGALIYSNVARDYSLVKGNNEVIDDIKKSERLNGAAVIIPGLHVELKEGFKYLDFLVESGIKAFKLYPGKFSHEFAPEVLERIAEYMSDKEIPMLVDAEEVDWKDLRAVLKEFVSLKVVLLNTHWGGNRYLFPLMEKYCNRSEFRHAR